MDNNVENYFSKILFPNLPKGGDSSEIRSEETSHSKDQTRSIHFKEKVDFTNIEGKTGSFETVKTPSEIIHKSIQSFKPSTDVCN